MRSLNLNLSSEIFKWNFQVTLHFDGLISSPHEIVSSSYFQFWKSALSVLSASTTSSPAIRACCLLFWFLAVLIRQTCENSIFKESYCIFSPWHSAKEKMAYFITEGHRVMEDALDAFRTKLRFQIMSFRFLRLVYRQTNWFQSLNLGRFNYFGIPKDTNPGKLTPGRVGIKMTVTQKDRYFNTKKSNWKQRKGKISSQSRSRTWQNCFKELSS